MILSPGAIIRLHLDELAWPDTREKFPVHGFLINHPAGAGLVDTGFGSGRAFLKDWRAVNRPVAEAPAEHDVSPADIRWVINTHLHWDHCGQNAVFRHAPFYVQRSEYEGARRPRYSVMEWCDFAGAQFELLNGEEEIVPACAHDARAHWRPPERSHRDDHRAGSPGARGIPPRCISATTGEFVVGDFHLRRLDRN